MTKKLTFTILTILISTVALSQSKWSLRTNGGFAASSSANGYYFSFDIGIPIIKSVELAPTFTYSNRTPNTLITDFWVKSNGNYGLTSSEPNHTIEYGENSSSISLILFFKPFDLLKSEKLKKHELLIGTGLSYSSFTIFNEQYNFNGSVVELVAMQVASKNEFVPYYCKLEYNYLFKKNLFAGLVFSANAFNGEAEILTGLQFGVKF